MLKSLKAEIKLFLIEKHQKDGLNLDSLMILFTILFFHNMQFYIFIFMPINILALKIDLFIIAKI